MKTLWGENKADNEINDRSEHKLNESNLSEVKSSEDIDVLDKEYFEFSDMMQDDIKDSKYDEIDSSYYEYTESELKDSEEKEISPNYYEDDECNYNSNDNIEKNIEENNLEHNNDLVKSDDNFHNIDLQERTEEIKDEEVELSKNNRESSDEIYNDIKEINDDISEKNDLFKDTKDAINENELLKEFSEKFQQENWERLSLDEKLDTINDFAEYQNEKLGIKGNTSIEYYHSKDKNDFGGYSPYTNAISININNIENAKETMDTIAHEYRHAFQFERASNPETERDYIFRENFENYVSPEIDFRAYLEQEVERDAREYASNYQDLVDNPSDECIETILNLNNHEADDINDYEIYNNLDKPIYNESELPYDFLKTSRGKNCDIENINSSEIISSLRNLEISEEKGGHLIDRHIGKTDQELIDRGIREASTFSDLETANEVINEILNDEEQYNRIKEWIEDEEREAKLVIDYNGDNSKKLGNLIIKNNGNYETREAHNARIILKTVKLENGKREFFVLTGFPRR